MFQLIVAVIAIALVIALTLASIFYGGEAFTRSSLKANVAAMVNQAQQISGANTLYRTDNGADAADPEALTTGDVPYLSEVPTPPAIADGEWAFDGNDYVTIGYAADVDTDDICDNYVKDQAGECTADKSGYQFPL